MCSPVASFRQLSLSTNQIDRLIPFGGMKKLRILSLGRNNVQWTSPRCVCLCTGEAMHLTLPSLVLYPLQIKKIEKLEDLADTLEELWLSYNQVC